MKQGKRINPLDYILPDDGLTDAEVADLLKDPLVRICNLYKIEDPDGNVVKFVPNGPQCEVLHAVYIEKEQRIAIPKARAIGFSTLIALILFDKALFAPDDRSVRAAIIDQTAPDAQAKLAKIKFAYDRMPEDLKDATEKNNSSELTFANGSTIMAGLKARGKTPQILHVTELGPIAHDDPARSQEIMSGAITSASGKDALVFIESTHKGGKGGDWYDLIKRSLDTPEQHRTVKDFRVMFFPWWQEARYTLAGDVSQIDKDTLKYFALKEAEISKELGRELKFTDGQRLFYYKEKERLKRLIYSELPTTLEECWMAPIIGAIYGLEVDKARIAGRITDTVLHYEAFPVYTQFDIGAAPNTKCWIFQVIGDRINLLESLTGGDDCNTPAQWAARLKDKNYRYGGHFLPHDGETLWKKLLVEAELKGVVVLDKPVSEWDNINDALGSFSRCFFNKTGCEDGLISLEAFRSKAESDGATVTNVPVHDWASHYATAFGYIHQVIREGKLVDRSAMPRKPLDQRLQAERKAGRGLARDDFRL